jgi:hypothetical protein
MSSRLVCCAAGSNQVAPTFFRKKPFGENVEGLSQFSDQCCAVERAVQTHDFEQSTFGVVIGARRSAQAQTVEKTCAVTLHPLRCYLAREDHGGACTAGIPRARSAREFRLTVGQARV